MQSEFPRSAGGSRSAGRGRHKLLILLVSASLLALCGRPAAADDSQIEKLEAQIQQIEARHQAEIRALQAEIHELRKERPARVFVENRVPPAVSVAQGPHVIVTRDRGYHFGFADADELNTIELFGRLHIDTGGYIDYKPGPKTLDQTGLASGIVLRRARLGVVGKFLGDWHYALVYDFGNTSDGTNPNNALANLNSSTAPS